MVIDIAQQEQEQKRQLWREQQIEKQKQMAEKMKAAPALGGTRAEESKARGETDQTEKGEGDDRAVSRSPRAIAARLREERAKEGEAKTAGGGFGGKITREVDQEQGAMRRLRTIYRIVNGTTGITIVGLIVTFVVMNGQLILGNWLKSKLTPELSLLEIVIVFILDLIFLTIVLVILVIFSIIVMAYDWDTWKELIKALPGIAWELIRSLFRTE